MKAHHLAAILVTAGMLGGQPVEAQQSSDSTARRQQRTLDSLTAALRAVQARLDSALRARAGADTAGRANGAPVGGAEATRLSPPARSAAQAQPGRGPNVFNPDIGVIGNLVAAVGESRGGTETLAPIPSLTLQESEASFQAVIDPYARADFFLAIGEEGIEVEEGYVSFTHLPGGLLLKGGRMRANFGRLNAFHNHTLPWVDRPLVMYNLLGGSVDDADTGIKDAGFSLSRLIPAGKLFVEAIGEVYRGESGTLFAAARRQDVSAIGRLRAYADLNENTNLEIGTSFARGYNDAGPGFATQLSGLDVTLRWRPLQRSIYRSFVARTELIASRRAEPDTVQRAFGLYASADYQFQRRWFLGARFDQSERARNATLRDRGVSAVLTFWPSEFSQVRGQYRQMRFADKGTANEFLIQFLFTIGAHGAHPF